MNGRYGSLPALPMSNKRTNLALLKKRLCCVFYYGKCFANNKSNLKKFFIK